MIGGVEGLALIPFLIFVWVSVPFFVVGAGLILIGIVTRLWRRPFASVLLKFGGSALALGVLCLSPFIFAAIKAKSDLTPHPWPVHTGTFNLTFDLRTARTFEALGLSALVDTRPSPLDAILLNHVSLAGDIAVDAIVTDRLRFRGKLTSIDVDDLADDDPKLLRSIWLYTAPLPLPDCAEMVRAVKDLDPAERRDLDLWLKQDRGNDLFFSRRADAKPRVSIYLEGSRPPVLNCVATLEVFW